MSQKWPLFLEIKWPENEGGYPAPGIKVKNEIV
jgi:hypothetical protein